MRVRRLVLVGGILSSVGCGTVDPPQPGNPLTCPSAGSLVITEVMANPVGADHQEWFEIFNPTSKAIELAGLTVDLESVGTNRYTFTKGRVEPGEYFVIGGVNDSERPAFIDYGYGDALGFMPNGAAILRIQCGDQIIDAAGYIGPVNGISRTLDGALAPDATLNDGFEHWCESVHDFDGTSFGTPRAPNDACRSPTQRGLCADENGLRDIVAPKPGQLRINEIMADPSKANDADGEWFEVWVDAAVDQLDLNGVAVHAGSATTTLDSDKCISVKGGQYLVFAPTKELAPNGNLPQVDFAIPLALTNSGATISLYANGGVDVIDTVMYPAAAVGHSWKADQSLESGAIDAPWCNAAESETYGAGDWGTPGKTNGGCPPILAVGECLEQGVPRKINYPQPGKIFISEFMANPAGSDADREWIELQLLAGADLNGLKLGNGTSSVTIESVDCIPMTAGSQVLLVRNADATRNGGLPE